MATVYSGGFGNTAQGVSVNDTRRKFNFGERVAELAPQQSPFFVYLSKVAKKATNDPVFKFLEQRHQWQRRNFVVSTAWEPGTPAIGSAVSNNLIVKCAHDKYGKISGNTGASATAAHKFDACYFLLGGQTIAVKADDGIVYYFKIAEDVAPGSGIVHTDKVETDSSEAAGYSTITAAKVTAVGKAVVAAGNAAVGSECQVVGSAWAEGTDSPIGWEDKMYDREGYCQIFKTGMNIFSGTALATEYRGLANEFQRIWQDKLMEHKMDIEQAMLFSMGTASNESSTSAPVRMTWGILPYTESYGKIYNMSYSSSGYDAFLDAMEDFFAPESGNSGNKLVLSSRKVITYLNKLGNGSFLNNSVGSSQYRLDVTTVPGAFGHTVTVVNTIFGNLHFVQEPLLRGPWEDYCVAVDMKNVAYRPLVGNGVSRDTFVETNVQDNGIDGRQDQIITECGLEISVPETHAILKFS
jgi:hypothetical protein